jgi:hypothetical protein
VWLIRSIYDEVADICVRLGIIGYVDAIGSALDRATRPCMPGCFAGSKRSGQGWMSGTVMEEGAAFVRCTW